MSVLTCSWGFFCADVLPAPILPHSSANCRSHWVQALHGPMHQTHFRLGISVLISNIFKNKSRTWAFPLWNLSWGYSILRMICIQFHNWTWASEITVNFAADFSGHFSVYPLTVCSFEDEMISTSFTTTPALTLTFRIPVYLDMIRDFIVSALSIFDFFQTPCAIQITALHGRESTCLTQTFIIPKP